MVNLDNLKLVLLDFDDTLCIHPDRAIVPDSENGYKRCIEILRTGKDAFNKDKTSRHMKMFIDECDKRNIRMGLMSATLSYRHMIAKEDWVADKYGIRLENYSVNSSKAKLDLMIAISKAYNMNRDEILLVDDTYSTLESIQNAGFQGATPIEIAEFISELQENQKQEQKEQEKHSTKLFLSYDRDI